MKKTSPFGRFAPVALLATSALLLTGCAAGSNESTGDSSTKSASGDCAEYSGGAVSKSVKVTGDAGAEDLKVEFTMPLKAKDLERTVLSKGDGDVTATGDTVQLRLSVFKGTDGTSAASEEMELPVGDPQLPPAFLAGIECVPVGSRVVVTVPATDLFGAAGNESLGIKGDDSLVLVTDVLDITPPLAPAAWSEIPPTVKFNGDKPPALTLPEGEPRPELLVDVIEEGDGAVVKSGDTFTANYQGTNWNTGEIFDQSYGKDPLTLTTTQVVPGFGAALVGQKVGTKLVVSIPPVYGYGVAGSSDNALAGQTLVFVIEILDAK